MHISQTKHASLKTGGPQYYLHDVPDYVKEFLRKRGAFDKPGPVVLYCSIHKFMDGVIYVCPTPLFSRVDGEGRFRIEGVRPGGYTLKTWQRRKRFPEQSMTLKVQASADLMVDLEMRRK